MPQSSQLISAFQGGSGAMAQYQSGAYTAQVARNNQVTANDNANLATFKGEQQVGIAQQRTAQTIGAQRAGAGASGVDVNSGSPVRGQEDTARIGAMDVQTIRANAARSAWGFRTQGENFANEAKLDEARGDMGALSSLIGGGANFAEKWDNYRKHGWQQQKDYNASGAVNTGPWASSGPGE